ncbi:helix-turn-helix domain-containing protein [Streptomyces sp. NPDC102360]|uniref:helix-turn-helix domain-containing protein n=1 Tax=Streptomyces sp. NPDC102360 TaxID=3366160 RepID=UPI0037F26C17
MDTQHTSAPPRAQSPVGGNPHPQGSGIIHENSRIAARFTVIGNHLAQHRKLSLTAIGLSVHIQSLPTGARVDIRTLAALFPEGTTRISAALRELEAHGYLRRERRRTSEGRVSTRTISCNHPGTHPTPAAADPAPSRPKRPPTPLHVPHPSTSAPVLLDRATTLLTTLHRADPRLLLSAKDTARLAPGVAAWLEREAPADAVRHALTSDIPDTLRHPAALLAHRLTALLPPLPPLRPPHTPPPPTPHPLHNCDGCDRAFRGREPGLCRTCTPDPVAAARP